MNDFRDPQQPAGPPPSGPAEPGFFGWLRGLGLARSEERWVGGVAGGIAERTRLDPLIFRGLFIVLTIFGGPGILLYLLGWLFLPERSGRIQAQELLRGRGSTAAYVILTVLGALFVLPVLFQG
ncbi:PspC domain-containing protein, partial [Leucobacter sp. M11]|uniref:PspC domain-containing protein n=1 Tax=Leucobacter sp. M11 TaxID=2993565 RepID=UPI002D7FD4ED